MRKVMRWRYYCEFCKKSGARGPAMQKHETHCVRNPNRACRMCVAAGDISQQPMAVLRDALLERDVEGLREAAQGCPACMLAAIVQDRTERQVSRHSEENYDFDYKAECEKFWASVNDAKEYSY